MGLYCPRYTSLYLYHFYFFVLPFETISTLNNGLKKLHLGIHSQFCCIIIMIVFCSHFTAFNRVCTTLVLLILLSVILLRFMYVLSIFISEFEKVSMFLPVLT